MNWLLLFLFMMPHIHTWFSPVTRSEFAYLPTTNSS